MGSMGLGDDLVEKVSEALLARNVVAVPIADIISILREAGVPASKCLLLQARLTDASMNSPLAAVPVVEAAAKVRVRVHQ